MKSLEKRTMRIAWLLMVFIAMLSAIPALIYAWSDAAQKDLFFRNDVIHVARDFEEGISTDLLYGGDLSIWESKLCESIPSSTLVVSCKLGIAEGSVPQFLSSLDQVTFTYHSLRNDSNRSEPISLSVSFLSKSRSLILWITAASICWIMVSTFLATKIARWLTETVVLKHVRKIQSSLVNRKPLTSDYSEIRAVLSEIEKVLEERSVAERKAAVASLVEAVSHDVRKPFSVIQIITHALCQMSDENEMRELLETAIPELEGSRLAIEGLLQDLLQLNSATNLNFEDVTPEILLTEALKVAFVAHPESDIQIDFQTEEELFVRVDMHKINRVFSNLFTNAAQAISYRGKLWIQVASKENRVQFIIGNPGFIPDDHRMRLFEQFFTSGKREGTGLGLAVAKKWVEAHGGAIDCLSEKNESHPMGKVEFIFDLPIGSRSHASKAKRPEIKSHSIQYALKLPSEARKPRF